MVHELLTHCLKYMVQKDGSDLYLSTGAVPSVKIHGVLKPIGDKPLEPGEAHQVALAVMSSDQQCEFEAHPEMNLAISERGIGRFRVNVFKQRNETALVIRNIKTEIPPLESLGVPKILNTLIMHKRGLFLLVGATGTGKSTTLASLIDHRNSNSEGHIITIEDPIEFVHRHKKSIINQREVGLDTDCYEDALQNTLRQAPDVILIGEIRSQETMQHAIEFAETGHLCLSTLHANNANQTLDRIINFFPEERRNQLLLDLSLNLQAIVSQRLIPTIDGKRVAAFEILIGTPLVRDLIHRGEVHEIKDVMQKSENVGMQTFDTALFNLYNEGIISLDEALKNADSANNLRLRISFHTGNIEKDELRLSLDDNESENDDQAPSDSLDPYQDNMQLGNMRINDSKGG